MFEGDLFQSIVNQMWFESPSDEGIMYSRFFNPFTCEALALILTMVSIHNVRHLRWYM